jgi:ABC transporter substrate binding protein
MAFGIGRRELIAGLGSAALAWPHAAHAQRTTMPVVGYLSGMSPDEPIEILAEFRRGLAETGYVEGRNLAIEYRWLEGRYDLIPTMLADLVERRVAVIVVPNTTTTALAAKAATRTIPIVFAVGSDPVAPYALCNAVLVDRDNVAQVFRFHTRRCDIGSGAFMSTRPRRPGEGRRSDQIGGSVD